MKKIFFTLLAIFMVSTSAIAENNFSKTQPGKAIIELNIKKTDINEQVVLNFNSVSDFNTFDVQQISGMIGEDDTCEVSATITVSFTANAGVNVGVAEGGGSLTTTISATVTASCEEIADTIKKVKAKLTEIVKHR